MNESENKNDINYHYVNTSLELTKGVPAITLIVWLPSIFFMNIASVIFSILASFLIIYLYRNGYTILEFISIIKFILRNQKPKLYSDEEVYDKNS